jgi:hypothetical protein
MHGFDGILSKKTIHQYLKLTTVRSWVTPVCKEPQAGGKPPKIHNPQRDRTIIN